MRGKCARYCPFFIRERRTFDGNIARKSVRLAAISPRLCFVSLASLGTVFRYLSGGKWGQDERFLAICPAEIAAFLLRNAFETFEKLEHILREIAADCRRNTEQKITPRLWNWL